MDDGSEDETPNVVEKFIKEEKVQIKYYVQENQGKMAAINNLMEHTTGDLIIDCDSDDHFASDAFAKIKKEFVKTEKKGLYAICFLKQKENMEIDGTSFKNPLSTMFDLYFKEGATGEKNLVYYADIRKKYRHELEQNEKFITEARMYHKMDEKYKIKCVNEPITIGDYQKNGYTSNILKTFKSSPYGYLKYFEEILQKDFKGVIWNKRLYAVKHYILFLNITNQRLKVTGIKNLINKILIIFLFIPGKIKTKKTFFRENKK
jgi:glycosyltransferase involved in cell wall biosynthesis